ncbi:glutathionylspermidine synthase family protein [Alicyclobacillus dauci]|uniref:Glutathionylspermidine synthase family protein n=1 Tax=Alicyclobacillus dauci TaxID=1475485 RepID=A0ABY6YXH8_9BACL|nr:glutathionylspermidine synthase family protein [Alicyclobacillus dauci]WAH35307.1 glutathionylspermidine synthase family protein [Alicyclobacillus dauci]
MIRDAAYYKEWSTLNDLLKLQGFTWGYLEEKGIDYQYYLLDLYRMHVSEYERIVRATTRIADVLNRTVAFLQSSPGLYRDLHLPQNTWQAVQIPSQLFSYFAHLDLIVAGDDIRVIELNCDTPTGVVESAVCNEAVCRYFKVASPNRMEDAIRLAFAELRKAYAIPETDTVYFSSYGWHEEDRMTTKFVRRNSGLRETQYVPLSDIRVSSEGVFTARGEPIRWLYRLYPLEYFSRDKGENGLAIGDIFLEHVASGKVRLINPPSAALCQAKGTLAVIWALHEANHPIYTEEQHQTIETYFLPTYVSAEALTGKKYVRKPVWGREGGGVSIVDEQGRMTASDNTPYYATQPMVYQKYTPMPQVTVKTWEGSYTGSMLVGSFLIGGVPSGLFLRVGSPITGNLSMFLPITVESGR